jgi:peptide/nickel transport system substrate-binding protein
MTVNSVRSKLTGKLAIIFLVMMTMILAACSSGGSTPSGSSGTTATTLRMVSAPGQTNPDNWNPYEDTNQGSSVGTQGLIYECLYFTNLYTGQAVPWLASSYSYNSDLTALTFHLNPAVKWSDGQPLTSADVVFTFQLMQKYPALDENGIWSSLLKGVSAPDNETVTFTLTHPDSTALFRIGDGQFIVPQHIWANQANPTKWANDQNPIGTGPYLLKSQNPNLITYTVNPNYWGIKPAVKTIEIPTITTNTAAITDMINGQLDWMSTGWSPTLDATYSQNPNNHTWFAASNTVMLYLNLTKAPFNNLNVRKAIDAAIDRSGLPNGVAEYAKEANPTGVIIPTFNNWISSQYQNASFPAASEVATDMAAAGYTLNKTTGYYDDASGAQFPTVDIDVPTAWSDWAQDVTNMVNDLQSNGIPANANFESGYTPYYTAISTGDYTAAISWTNSGPSPWFAYQALLQSSNGTGATVSGTDFERWNATTGGQYATEVDQDLLKYEGTQDHATQLAAIQDIENVMVTQLPVLPLTVNVYWDEYSTANWTNFPTASNPYDSGAVSNAPDYEYVILHLKPAH